MKKLILSGEIGCGKSTMIRTALGSAAARAGGFVTLRRTDGAEVLGFDLASVEIWTNPEAERERFLDFSASPRRDDGVFSGLGVRLLTQALDCPFAVLDEFGGLEMRVPEFRDALYALLESEVPCIGVLKTPAALGTMARRITPGDACIREYEAIRRFLEQRDDVRILPVHTWQDRYIPSILCRWAETYAGGEP